MKMLQRQGLNVSVRELRDLADELDKERLEENNKLGINITTRKKFQINIINKSKCSDTWVIEK